MSGTVSHGRDVRRQADTESAARTSARRRAGWVAAGLVLAAATGAAAAWQAGLLSAAASFSPAQGIPAPATATVTRQDIASTTPVVASLGYAGSYTVTGQGGGTLTWLPSPGQVISQGEVLYQTDNGSPVVLLDGAVPAWRTLDEGVTGADVAQLNHDLVQLGDADRADIAALGWDYFSWQTKTAVQQLQSTLRISSPSGSLSPGQLVFEPAALRVSQVIGSLGGPADGPVLMATSDEHVVTIPLDAAQQSEVRTGDAVTVTLPDGTTTPGVVTCVGTVATDPGGAGGSGATATILVYVKLSHPHAARSLDQAPVTVNITTATVKNALVVPVGALLARSTGGYAVEVIGAQNARRLAPVAVGLFDDADGLVQVTGALTPGQRVVVPAA